LNVFNLPTTLPWAKAAVKIYLNAFESRTGLVLEIAVTTAARARARGEYEPMEERAARNQAAESVAAHPVGGE